MWGERIVPRITDRALSGHEVEQRRAETCRPLSGRVLQPGFGSGRDLEFLPSAVDSVAAVEPSDVGWALSERRRSAARVVVERLGLDGQRIPAPDDSFDSALITFSLCTIPDPGATLAEIVRCVRPCGVVAVLEHGLSPDPQVARWQHRLDSLESGLCGGCHLVRDTDALLAESGLLDIDSRHEYFPGPRISRPWGWLTLASARVG